MKYYFKKHRIKIFFLLVLSLIVFGCMGHRTKRILRIERKEYQTY